MIESGCRCSTAMSSASSTALCLVAQLSHPQWPEQVDGQLPAATVDRWGHDPQLVRGSGHEGVLDEVRAGWTCHDAW